MKRICGVIAALVLGIGAAGIGGTAHAASFGCTSGGQAGATVPAGTSDVKTGGLIDYSCNAPWVAGGTLYRYSGGSWGQYNPFHVGSISGHAHNCGNGLAGRNEQFLCPESGQFNANSGYYLTGPEWVYEQNLTADMAVDWNVTDLNTGGGFHFYVCPDGDVHGGLPSGGCPS